MSFSAGDVKALREKTGCGMMDCKKALAEAKGDLERAVDILRENGMAVSAKKAGRVAVEGMAFACVKGKVGALVEVNAETDFVAKNAAFIGFVETCAETIINCGPKDVDELLRAKAAGCEMTIEELLHERIQTTGENMKVRRFVRFEGPLAAYNHMAGKIGVLVQFETSDETAENPEFLTFAKDIAMQVAAAAPSYLESDEVPAETLEHERKILTEQVINDGKPEKVAEKIVQGKISKFYKENCLLEQPFVKDSSLTVQGYVDQVAKTIGNIKVLQFARFEKGEGLEKKEDNFADEVASMVR